jgi:hypothetical protein
MARRDDREYRAHPDHYRLVEAMRRRPVRKDDPHHRCADVEERRLPRYTATARVMPLALAGLLVLGMLGRPSGPSLGTSAADVIVLIETELS